MSKPEADVLSGTRQEDLSQRTQAGWMAGLSPEHLPRLLKEGDLGAGAE